MPEESARPSDEPDIELDPRPTGELDRMRSPDLPEQRGSRLAWLVLLIALILAALVMWLGFDGSAVD